MIEGARPGKSAVRHVRESGQVVYFPVRDGFWYIGAYDSEEAAMRSFDVPPEKLTVLSRKINYNSENLITLADLEAC